MGHPPSPGLCNCLVEVGEDEDGNDTFTRVPSGNCPIHGSN